MRGRWTPSQPRGTSGARGGGEGVAVEVTTQQGDAASADQERSQRSKESLRGKRREGGEERAIPTSLTPTPTPTLPTVGAAPSGGGL